MQVGRISLIKFDSISRMKNVKNKTQKQKLSLSPRLKKKRDKHASYMRMWRKKSQQFDTEKSKRCRELTSLRVQRFRQKTRVWPENIGIYFVLECWQYIANILPIYIPIQKKPLAMIERIQNPFFIFHCKLGKEKVVRCLVGRFSLTRTLFCQLTATGIGYFWFCSSFRPKTANIFCHLFC